MKSIRRRNIAITISSFMLLLGLMVYTRFDLFEALYHPQIMRIEDESTFYTMSPTTVITENHQERVEEVNLRRKQSIEDYCIRFGRSAPEKISSAIWKSKGIHQKPRVYFSDTVKLLYCETPKCGTTQWRNLMLILDGYLHGYAAGSEDNFAKSWKHNFLWNRFKAGTAKGVANIDKRLQNYFKVMAIREPLERLVSAFRDKLETDKNPVYAPVSRQIHNQINSNTSDGLATFEEFIDYILLNKNPATLDPHWKPYSDLCDPCNIEYDFIAKLETIYDDVAYITEKIGVARDRILNENPQANVQERRMALYEQYFNKIPLSKRIAIFKYYKGQYDMFDYAYPTFINETEVAQV